MGESRPVLTRVRSSERSVCTMSPLVLLLCLVSYSSGEGGTWGREELGEELETCSPCQVVECDSLYQCQAGVVPDRCGCCQVCARSEGELCDVRGGEKYGTCGDNLDCQEQEESGEYLCVCTQTNAICGSDGITYDTPCQLNEESVRRESSPSLPLLSMEYWGPCKESPVIISPPSDTYGPIGANLTLDCEARGYPAPTISWQYDNVEGRTIVLPSDDQDISIQMRGGPEPLMVTGWAQILSLDPGYSGMYHCIAANSEGTVHAKAAVGVYRNEL